MTKKLTLNFGSAAQDISARNPIIIPEADLATNPLHDPRVKAITTELQALIPQITLTVRDACRAAELYVGYRYSQHAYNYDSIHFEYDEALRFFDKMDAQQRLKWHGADERGGWLSSHSNHEFNEFMQSTMRSNKNYVYPRKTLSPVPGEVNEAWHNYLQSTDPVQAAHNARIEQLFSDWNGLIDFEPERELRKNFLAQLKNDNHLGQLLMNWGSLPDGDIIDGQRKQPYYFGGKFEEESRDGQLSRFGVLQKINRIFEQTYCRPLGLVSNTRIVLSKTKRKRVGTLGSYDLITQDITLTVPDEFGRIANATSTECNRNQLLDQWKNKAPLIILMFLEERLHKFAHQVCLAHANGTLKQAKRWESFARGMSPQFDTTDGRFYAQGTYYTLNPAELHAEGLCRDTFKVIYKAYVQAYEANQLDITARNHRPDTTTSPAMERALKRSSASLVR